MYDKNMIIVAYLAINSTCSNGNTVFTDYHVEKNRKKNYIKMDTA